MVTKPRIFIFGNSHVSAFSGSDCIVPDIGLHIFESEDIIYNIQRLGPSCAYNFFWNPAYYQKAIEVLESNNIKNEIVCLLIGELDCRIHIGLNSELKSKPLDECIEEVIDRFNVCLLDLKKRGYKVMVISVQPASNYPPSTDPNCPVHGSYEYRNKLTREFNTILERKAKVHAYLFCSIFDKLMIDTYTPNMEYFMDYVHLRGSLVRPLFDKELLNCITPSKMDFTFGIITNSGIYLETIIESIKNQKIPKYEIIIVGNCNILSNDNVRVIPFDESIKPNWVNRKKNIVCEMAKYDNIVMLHDYIYFMDGWYKGFLEFGEDYQVCVNKIIRVNCDRYIDYFISPHGPDGGAFEPYIPTRRMLPYDFKLTPQLSKLCYISGAYFCIKKDLALKYPSNEMLSWGQEEDIELFLRLGNNNIIIKCNQMSSVQLLKEKEYFGGWDNEINKEEVNILKSLSKDICNSIFNNLSHTFFSRYGKFLL